MSFDASNELQPLRNEAAIGQNGNGRGNAVAAEDAAPDEAALDQEARDLAAKGDLIKALWSLSNPPGWVLHDLERLFVWYEESVQKLWKTSHCLGNHPCSKQEVRAVVLFLILTLRKNPTVPRDEILEGLKKAPPEPQAAAPVALPGGNAIASGSGSNAKGKQAERPGNSSDQSKSKGTQTDESLGHGDSNDQQSPLCFTLPIAQIPSHLAHINIHDGLSQAVKLLFFLDTDPQPDASPDVEGGHALVGLKASRWEGGQTLEHLINDLYPNEGNADDESGAGIQASKLRFRYLRLHANLSIEWTSQLPEHLSFDFEEGVKTLRLFGHPRLLDVASFAAVGRVNPAQSMNESIPFGSYSPAFLYETLQTYRLLFPHRDSHWAKKHLGQRGFISKAWHRILSLTPNEPEQLRVTDSFTNRHKLKAYDRPLTNRRELFKRYPHWAVRLHILYEEALDPSPTWWWQRWTERRKGPRHAYTVACGALLLALLFGIAATALAAVQLWVAYCDWQGDDVPPGCRVRGAGNTTTEGG